MAADAATGQIIVTGIKSRVETIAIFGIVAVYSQSLISNKITGFVKHGINRAIGNGGDRAGVSTSAWRDAIANPIKVVSGVDKAGRPYVIYFGKSARVVVNPQTGKIISMNPLGRGGVW